MSGTSETRKRLYVEGDKVRCGEPGRSRGKRCEATLMIDGKIACKAGHEFSLDELVEAAFGNDPWGRIAHWATAVVTGKETMERVNSLAEGCIHAWLVPPYSTALPDEEEYRWVDLCTDFPLLLALADEYNSTLAETLRLTFIERSNRISDRARRALRQLMHEADNYHDAQSLMKRDQLVDCCARQSIWPSRYEDLMRFYYVEAEACEILGETKFLWLYQDSLREALYAQQRRVCPLVFTTSDNREKNLQLLYFKLYHYCYDITPVSEEGPLWPIAEILIDRNRGEVNLVAVSSFYTVGGREVNSAEAETVLGAALASKETWMTERILTFPVLPGMAIRVKDKERLQKEAGVLEALQDLRERLHHLRSHLREHL